MYKPYIILSALLSSLLVTMPAAADIHSDFTQPIEIESNHDELDLRANILTFRDNVIIQQGTLRITADRLDVVSEGDEAGAGEVFIASGTPATYQQEVEPGILVEASAEEIRYDSRDRVLTLNGNAQMKQSNNQVNANRITYFVEEQRVTAERDEDSDERVRTIFQPRNNSDNTPEPNLENNGTNS